jgi:hypothetical protein
VSKKTRKTKRRRWTQEELSFVAEHYQARGCEYCAKQLGKSTSAVYNQAFARDFGKRQQFIPTKDVIAAIKKLHPKGYTDAAIAAWLRNRHSTPVERHRINRLRESLGLKSNKNSDLRRKQVAAKTREQLKQSGCSSLAEYRVRIWNQWKRELGWPEDLTVRAVQALEVFYSLGHGIPITRLDLCKAMGIESKSRTDPKSNAKGGTVLAELIRAGFIGSVHRGVPGAISGKRGAKGTQVAVDFYYLKHGVEPSGTRVIDRQGQKLNGDAHGPLELASQSASGDDEHDLARGHEADHGKATREGQGGRSRGVELRDVSRRSQSARDDQQHAGRRHGHRGKAGIGRKAQAQAAG